jgi:hypothetical protein
MDLEKEYMPYDWLWGAAMALFTGLAMLGFYLLASWLAGTF